MTDSEKIDSILDGLQSFGENMTLLKRQMTSFEEKQVSFEEKLASMESNMKSEIQELRQDVKLTNLVIETEIRKTINVIGEGHFDLSRKLDDALKVETEKEMALVRLNVVESKVNKMKEGLAQAAGV